MKIKFLGGVRTVTGTCCHITINDLQALVDCGMYQGENSEDINKAPFPFTPSKISYVFLTHAHIDHSGLLPKLVREGFNGKIITTDATADLAEIMLYDSAQIQQKDAEWLIKKALRKGAEPDIKPLYTTADVNKTLSLFKRKAYLKTEHLGSGLKYRFLDAGHILGSGSLELIYQDSAKEKTIVFSGDIGKKGNPIMNDPQTPTSADYIVMESTYGNRNHRGMKESIDELAEAIRTTFKKGGNVLIPAFAIGRTQDILYTLNKFIKEKRFETLNVYVDSPLAEEATKVYLSHPECYDAEALAMLKEKKSRALKLQFTTTVEDSMKINKIKSGAIIIAGSGMCEGGRIVHHFKHNLWRSECSVIFSGFQAEGTRGRKIIEGAKTVDVLGEDIAVKARIYTIGGFSAHADRDGLFEWLGGFSGKPEVFIVHGEENVSIDFEDAVKKKFVLITHVPRKNEEFEI
jgi:metallo-beta-lactamase family protein